MTTRVRFAPSPTGNLHIGSIRTALFNWIFAHHQKGTYVLRIEDTDFERSKPEYEKNILDGLAWLGLNNDEGPLEGGAYGPYRQKERFEKNMYQTFAQQLLDSKKAYYCFCTEEELQQRQEEIKSATDNVSLNCQCSKLSADNVEEKLKSTKAYTMRFKMPTKSLTFQDLIRGEVTFDLSLIPDFVLIKSDKTPTYNFAVVVDDLTMKITHVIRGEDHISNTPKQICLYQALEKDCPQFAHLPMILGPDKSKMSKRHGATSITQYQNMGYLSDALFNYLVLLGWTPPDDQEILSKEEIVKLFSFEKISKSGAVFDIKKLTWMNGQYIRKQDKETLYSLTQPFISASNNAALQKYTSEQLIDIVFSLSQKLELLTDINEHLEAYTMSFEKYQQKIKEFTFSEAEKQVLQQFLTKLKTLSANNLDMSRLSQIIDQLLAENNNQKGLVFKSLRFACSALKSGPDLKTCLIMLGAPEIIRRLEQALH
jgi:glutamyl-tRNA synthetase